MRKINNSQLMNAHTVELFTRAHQSVLDGKQVDEANLKTFPDHFGPGKIFQKIQNQLKINTMLVIIWKIYLSL